MNGSQAISGIVSRRVDWVGADGVLARVSDVHPSECEGKMVCASVVAARVADLRRLAMRYRRLSSARSLRLAYSPLSAASLSFAG